MTGTLETSGVWNGKKITEDLYSELQDAHFQTAEKIADRARVLVPVGELSAHGKGAAKRLHLRDTIRAKHKRKVSRVAGFVRGLISGDYETAIPGAWVFAGNRKRRVFWAHWVEFGTYFKDAHPFMRPAADANFNAALEDAARAGQRVINKQRRTRTAARKAGIEGLQR